MRIYANINERTLRRRFNEPKRRKRPPSLKMIWRLHQGLGIPAESLIKADHEATRISAALYTPPVRKSPTT